MEFEPFPKIPRLKREIVITEKIDGTNAQIALFELDDENAYCDAANDDKCLQILPSYSLGGSPVALYAGSRKRWITPEDDNFGFARWVVENQDELYTLGPGRHFGEWWGAGIQRKYGLDHKRFSLFNVKRWREQTPPSCCHIVPVLSEGVDVSPDLALDYLREYGSFAAPGFMNPEGIIVYHSASRSMFKMTLDGDQHKG